jgi:hypothetical protein
MKKTAAPAAPTNALRTILLVAARGEVGTTMLAELQQALPAADWGVIELRGWNRLAPLLSWCTVVTGASRSMSVRELLSILASGASDRGLREDVNELLRSEQAALDGTIDVPCTEPGVRLSRKRSGQARQAYEAALDLLRDPLEAGLLSDVERPVAVQRLRETLLSMVPAQLFEASDGPQVARAILRTEAAFRIRQDRVGVEMDIFRPERVHRLYLLSRLSLVDLAAALDLPVTAVRRSDHPKSAVSVFGFQDAEALLRKAAAS